MHHLQLLIKQLCLRVLEPLEPFLPSTNTQYVKTGETVSPPELSSRLHVCQHCSTPPVCHAIVGLVETSTGLIF